MNKKIQHGDDLDGYVVWRGTIRGLRKAEVELQELAAHTKHELHLMYAPNNAVIAKRNVPQREIGSMS